MRVTDDQEDTKGRCTFGRRLEPCRALGQDLIETPDFVGLSVDAALTYPDSAGVRLEGPEPDGPPILGLCGTVVRQESRPGVLIPRSSPVAVIVDSDDGGAGVREPRRPLPSDGAGYAEEAVDGDV